MRQYLAVLLAMAMGGFSLGMLVNVRRARAGGEGLVHVHTTGEIGDKKGHVEGRVVGVACQSEQQGPVPAYGRGPCLVVTQEQ